MLAILWMAGTNESLAPVAVELTYSALVSFDLHHPDGIHSLRVSGPSISSEKNMSAIVDNTARAPMLVAQSIQRFPVMANDFGSDEMETVAKILIRARQTKALEVIIASDGVTERIKGVLTRLLAQHRQSAH